MGQPGKKLRDRNANSNHYVVHIPVVFGPQFFLDKELYCRDLPKNKRPTAESKEERKERFLSLMEKNRWTQAELSRHLGVSRAWITKAIKRGSE